jgi:hypothetical protein
MRLELAKLREAAELLFDHLKEQGYDVVEVPQDYYWDVIAPERYDPYNKPVTELGLGQLTDDWQEIEKVLRKENDPLGSDLVRLSALLRAVGEQVLG